MVFHKVLKCNLGKLFFIYTHSDTVWQKLNLNLRDNFSKTEPTPALVNSKLESNQFNKSLSWSLQSWGDQGRVNAVQGWMDGSIKKFSAPLMASNQLRHHHPQNYCNEPPNSNMSMIGTIIIMTTIVFIITIGIFIITVIKITTDVNEIGVKRSLPDLSYYHKIGFIKAILTCSET